MIHEQKAVPPRRRRNEIDGPWKFILADFFESFMSLCFPELSDQIDWPRGYETLDKELEKVMAHSKTGKRISDMLFKIWMKDGEEKWILIHLEIQARKEKDFSKRMFIYNYRTYDRYQKPVINIALLLDDHPDWRPCSFELEDPFTQKPYLQFHYRLVKLLDYQSRKKELEERKDLFSLVLLAQLAVLETRNDLRLRLQTKLTLIKNLLKRGLTREQTSQLYKFFDWVMILPPELMSSYSEQIKYVKEAEARLWSTPYVSTFEQLARIKGHQEGRQEGLQEGRQKGRQEGLAVGREGALRDMFDRQLRRRFPKTITAAHLHLIHKADSESLSLWMERFADAKKIEFIFED